METDLELVKNPPNDLVIYDPIMRAKQLYDAADRLNTKRARDFDWRVFEEFCSSINAQSLPASVDTIARLIGAYADTKTPATITRWLATISHAHREHEIESPCADPRIRRTLRGLRETKPAKIRKQAITKDLVEAMIETCGNRLLDKRDAALLAIGFYGGWRRGELVAVNAEDIREQIGGKYPGLYILVHQVGLNRTKAGKDGELKEKYFPYGTQAVKCLYEWMSLAHIETGAIFRSVNNRSHVGDRMTDQAVALIVKKRCAKAGIDGDFAAHSLRSGLVTELRQRGASLDQIAKQTGQSLGTVLRYDQSDAGHNNAVRLLDDITIEN